MKNLITHFESFLLAQKRVAHNTFVAYKQDVAQFCDFLKECAIIDPERIEQKHIKEFLLLLHTQTVSSRTVARKLSALRLFFLFLRDHKNIPIASLDLVTPQQAQTLPVYCTAQEIEELFACADSDISRAGHRNALMVKLLYAAGLRASELVALRMSDIRSDEHIITLVGKGGKVRSIPLPETIAQLLMHYCKEVRPRLFADKEGNTLSTEYVFAIRHRAQIKPLSRQAVWSIVKNIVKKMRTSKIISPHTLRHSLATHSLEHGWDLRSLQQLLGHESINTVQVYTHVAVDRLKEVYKKKHPRD